MSCDQPTLNPSPARRRDRRDAGVALISFMLMVLFAVGAAACTMALTSTRVSRSSTERMQAFYAADSGAQIASFELRTAEDPSDLDGVTFVENLGADLAVITITETEANLFTIESRGTSGEHQVVVEMVLLFEGFLPLDSGISITVDPTVTFTGDTLPLRLKDRARLDGRDHDAQGNVLPDQSTSVPAVGLSAVGHDLEIDVVMSDDDDDDGGAELVGDLWEDAPSFTAPLQALRDFARNHADINLSNRRHFWWNLHNGHYGTPENPVLVYASLGEDGRIHMLQDFEGWGTLVVEVADANDSAFLQLRHRSAWHGPIVVYLTGETDMDDGEYVLVRDDARIIGGLSFLHASGNVYFDEGDALILEDDGQLLYSSELNLEAKGVRDVANSSASTIAYRIHR